jgi:hypothetical protein
MYILKYNPVHGLSERMSTFIFSVEEDKIL